MAAAVLPKAGLSGASSAELWRRGAAPRLRAATEEQAWVRWLCIGATFGFLTLLLVVPLASVFVEAFRNGVEAYFASFNDPQCWSAVRLTLLAAIVSVPLNLQEGLYSRAGNRIARFHDSMGSAKETMACLDVSAAAEYLPREVVIADLDRIDHIVATLWRLSGRRSFHG